MPKSSRTPPSRVFERYVLTRLVDASAGLTDLHDSLFLHVKGPGSFDVNDPFLGAGAPGTVDTVSAVTFIGFDFQIDGVTYDRWCASTNGWLALVDPTTGTFARSEVISGSFDRNNAIRPTFTSKAVLLAPWFDSLRNRLNEPSQLLVAPFYNSTTKINRLRSGSEPASSFVNGASYGISYYVDRRSSAGRRLIVRWSSISDRQRPSSVIRFEVVLCENGSIEYRYAPKDHLIVQGSVSGSRPNEGATVGIFMPNGSNRWRDFSRGLGYVPDSREAHDLGGYAYSLSYVDSFLSGSQTLTASYAIGLTPFANWPGQSLSGCTMTFSPPKLGRRVLPKRLAIERDARHSYPGSNRNPVSWNGFDDKLSQTFASSGSTPTIVSYPTTLARSYGGTGLGVLERIDLYSGDLYVTGNTVNSAMDQYVLDRPTRTIDSFSEVVRPEQDPAIFSSSFSSSSIDGFAQPLRSKSQVRLALSVMNSVVMPSDRSSIYYYNKKTNSWQIPFNSTYVIDSGSSNPPSPNPYAGGDVLTSFSGSGPIFEDARGFDAVGNPISSGTVRLDDSTQSDAVIGSRYSTNDAPRLFGKDYAKSVRNNKEYAATIDETFSLPIDRPFLVEKAVFQVPFAAGRGWFDDITQCFLPLNAYKDRFNLGGPALTFALFRQVKLGKGPDAPTTLDLVMTGTLTHVHDNTSSVVISNFAPFSSIFQIRPVGFMSYAGKPGCVIPDDGTHSFTGSAKIEATALNTVGVSVAYTRTFLSSSDAASAAAATDLLTQRSLVLKNDMTFPTTSVSVASVSPFGRSGTGMRQSGRSLLGREHVTWQGMSDQGAIMVNNPFYVEDGLSTQQSNALNVTPFTASAAAMVRLGSYVPSPYLVMPNDRFVLAVSKTRPAVLDGPSTFSGTVGHDVSLVTGDVQLVLYGSHVKQGAEWHEFPGTSGGSNFVHESIGIEPVLDQFDVPYPHERSGSFYDNAMFGSLSTTVALQSAHALGLSPGEEAYVIVQKTRDRRASWLNARNYPQLGTGSVDLNVTPSKAFRAEQWWEMAPDISLAQFVDSSERYWDSMMPSVSECFAADGCGIFITPNGTFGSSFQIDTGPSGSSGFNPRTTRMGWMWLDYNVPFLLGSDYRRIINPNWSKAFPFEPRYKAASRQVNVERSLVANMMYGGSPTVQQISPVMVNGFAFGTTLKDTARFNTISIPNSVCWEWLSDVDLTSTNIFGYYVTGSASRDDMARGLFGFGDRNTCYVYNGVILGTNHAVDFRDVEGPHPDGVGSDYDNNFFKVSPVIRGWKYGVLSGIPTYSKAYWRTNRFGQFRDMLEQRPMAKFYQKVDKATPSRVGSTGVQPGPVTVTFIDPSTGRRTTAENTWSSNLSTECTSSLPFFDGRTTNRLSIDPRVLNLSPNVVRHDVRGNIHIA